MSPRLVVGLASLMLICRLVLAGEGDAPRARISTVSTNGMPRNIVPAGSNWNFGPGALQTINGWQYAAYWDDACQVSVARRQLPDGAWSVVLL